MKYSYGYHLTLLILPAPLWPFIKNSTVWHCVTSTGQCRCAQISTTKYYKSWTVVTLQLKTCRNMWKKIEGTSAGDQIRQLKSKVNELEWRSRRANLEVCGTVPTENENLLSQVNTDLANWLPPLQGWSSCTKCVVLIKSHFPAPCSVQSHRSAKIAPCYANRRMSFWERNVIGWNVCFRLATRSIPVLSWPPSELLPAQQSEVQLFKYV